ncbi:MAG TPA: hypothetical protein VMH26_19785 [Burkholderiales bacterium]|nr:hypothetical protein [Burkholderiales bacterium]
MRQSARSGATAFAVGLAFMLLGSCASTSMVSSKKNPAYTGPELKRLIVIGATSDARVRRAFENEFVAKLKAAGVAAQASYLVIPEIDPAKREQLREAVKAAGVDGVLAARLVKVERNANALQEFNFDNRSAGFYEYYGSGSTGTFDPSSGGMSNLITIHFDLYSVAGSQLVWGGDAATYPSTDVKAVTDGLAYAVIKTLKEQKLI